MMDFLIGLYIATPFLIGVIAGGSLFGALLAIVGWMLGYEAAMRTVNSWMRPKIDEAHGDLPNLPPLRERRAFPTTPGRWM